MKFKKVVALSALLLSSACVGGRLTDPNEKAGACFKVSGTVQDEFSASALPLARTVSRASLGFTQGLFFRNGRLFESTGLTGSSEIRELNPATGAILRSARLPKRLFGEGAIEVDGQILVGTWKGKTLLYYDLESFELTHAVDYPKDIWGLATDGKVIIVSDGTNALSVLDRASLMQVGEILVTFEGAPLNGLNELEWVQGRILANVWPTSGVYSIDPDEGTAVKVFDAKFITLQSSMVKNPEHVLNGIAYDEASKSLLLTGKNWDTFIYFAVC